MRDLIDRLRGGMTTGTLVCVVLALLWSLLLLVATFVAPVYGTSACAGTAGGPSECVDSTRTLFQVNGIGAVVVMVIPLVATIVVGLGLGSGSRAGMTAAWTTSAILAVLTLLALLSVGVVWVPVVVMLLLACVLMQTYRARLRYGAA
jgi:hypothetical protein